MLNGFLLNPAMAGCETYIPLRLTVRQQWAGINNAPDTYAISAHSRIGKVDNMGVGGYIFSDWFGPVIRTGLQAAYSYHMNLPKIDSKLALGISATAFQYRLDQSILDPLEDDDAALDGSVEGYFVPDANFGAYLYRHNYFVGVAATQLLEYNVDVTSSEDNKMIRHYFATAGYKFNLNEDFEMEPSVLVKGTEKTPFQLDVNLKTYYKKNYWLALSYRTGNSAIAILGLKVQRYYIGYAFDYTFSDIRNYSHGSHEIMVGVNFKENKEQGSSLL